MFRRMITLRNTIYRATIILGFMALLGSSCTFKNEEEYFGPAVCDSSLVLRDTVMVDYQNLSYIFTGICAQCHNSIQTPRPAIKMDTYENVVASINTGKVLPAIRHEGKYRMPYNQPKLSDCEIQRIQIWIDRNMPKKY